MKQRSETGNPISERCLFSAVCKLQITEGMAENGSLFHITGLKEVNAVKEVKVKTHFFCFFNIHFYF